MNFTPETTDEAALELEEKNRRIEELETEVAELTARLAELTEPAQTAKAVRSIKSYKPGEYVSVLGPLETEPVNGRVIELIHGGSSLAVATSKGEMLIGDPSRIRKQSEKW